MRLGIVGHERKKFGPKTEEKARQQIRLLLDTYHPDVVISGGCHLGGIDIWAKEEAEKMGITVIEHLPTHRRWQPNGYKARNLRIVKDSDVVVNIVVDQYPRDYKGMVFDHCYHCNTTAHIKSGGCWTAKQAGKHGYNVVIQQED